MSTPHRFHPANASATIASVLLGLTVLVSLAQIPFFGWLMASIDDLGTETRSLPSLALTLLMIPEVLLTITTPVVFLVWFWRVHKNLPALGAKELRFTPGWAVGGWFVPFLNLARPVMTAAEIWKASDPSIKPGVRWQDEEAPFFVGFWWASFLLMNFLARLTVDKDTLLDLSSKELLVNIAHCLVTAVAGVFAVLLIQGIQRMQALKWKQVSALGQEHEGDAMPVVPVWGAKT